MSSPRPNPLLLPPEEFAHDAESRLGRANGNTYRRRPPLDNTHDGQIMVRLKKKRFIIIDYGIVPTEDELAQVSDVPHIVVPEGAGERLCATRNCPRIGVPVQLYDSDPSEPPSLYLRGGLCFSCQRTLNEKRRTQRKRKSDAVDEEGGSLHHPPTNASNQQRYRLNGSVLDLNPDAVIINGPIEGTRTRGPDYPFPRIGQDLVHLVNEITRGTNALFHTAYHAQQMRTLGSPASVAQINGLFQSTFRDMSRATYLITQWKASWDEHLGGMMATAGMGGMGVRGGMQQPPQVPIPAPQPSVQPHLGAGMMGASMPQQQPQQQQQVPPQAQGSAEEKNENYDLSEFYEEV